MSAMLEARVAFLERQIDTLLRRRASPFALARTTMNVDDSGPVQTVQAQLDALSIRDKIPVLYGYGVTGAPPVAADMQVVYLDGDRSKAVIIASGHQSYRLRGLAAGDSALYDSRGHRVWLTSSGISLVGNVGHTGNYTLTGNLSVTGSVIAGAGGTDQVGLQTHHHTDGTPGPTPGT